MQTCGGIQAASVSMGKPARGDSICQNKQKCSCSHIAYHWNWSGSTHLKIWPTPNLHEFKKKNKLQSKLNKKCSG